MQSKIQQILKPKYNPVAILWSDQKPDGALQFAKNRWGCVMSLFAQAAKGKTAAINRETAGCGGGEIGLGFGRSYHERYPGGIECFYRFLSSGNADSEAGRSAAENYRRYNHASGVDDFLQGERYIKTPELVKKRIDKMPTFDLGDKYVIFKPLQNVEDNKETPEIVVFLANPEQLSALVVLANYACEDGENVIIPFGAGCHNIGILAYQEAKREKPRAVIGLTDLSARLQVVNSLGREFLTFAMPYKLYQEMESNANGSFLNRNTWRELTGE